MYIITIIYVDVWMVRTKIHAHKPTYAYHNNNNIYIWIVVHMSGPKYTHTNPQPSSAQSYALIHSYTLSFAHT